MAILQLKNINNAKEIFIKTVYQVSYKIGVGKVFNFMGKILFGKITFVTGYNPDSKEFYKTTTTRRIDKTHDTLKETGHTELEEHADLESVENALRSLAAARRRKS